MTEQTKNIQEILKRYFNEQWLLYLEQKDAPTRIGKIVKLSTDFIVLQNDRNKKLEWIIPISNLGTFAASNPNEKPKEETIQMIGEINDKGFKKILTKREEAQND